MATEKSQVRYLTNPIEGDGGEECLPIDTNALRAPVENVRIAVSIVQHEIDRLRKRSQNNFLDIVEAKLLKDYIFLLLQLHKEKIFPELMSAEELASEADEIDLDSIGSEELANITIAAAKKVGYGIDVSNGVLRKNDDEPKEK